jgi:hypothetical protein
MSAEPTHQRHHLASTSLPMAAMASNIALAASIIASVLSFGELDGVHVGLELLPVLALLVGVGVHVQAALAGGRASRPSSRRGTGTWPRSLEPSRTYCMPSRATGSVAARAVDAFDDRRGAGRGRDARGIKAQHPQVRGQVRRGDLIELHDPGDRGNAGGLEGQLRLQRAMHQVELRVLGREMPASQRAGRQGRLERMTLGVLVVLCRRIAQPLHDSGGRGQGLWRRLWQRR